MSVVCPHCSALSFLGERLNCCHNGKVHIDIPSYPDEIRALFLLDTPAAINFRKNILKYNTCHSFASTQANLDDAPRGVYKICGQMYTNTAGLYPPGGRNPTFNQLYIYRSSEAAQLRLQNHYTDGCTSEVMETISSVINDINPYALLYKSMHEKYNEEREQAAAAGREPAEVRMYLLAGPDRRRYNAPEHDEVGAIFVGDQGAPSKPPDIIVYSHQNALRQVPMLSQHADPMAFVLLFPNGHPGWSTGIPHVGQNRTSTRNKVTALQYAVFHWVQRPGVFNPLLHAGPLSQRKIVSDYFRVEALNLKHQRNRQSALRVETYQGLHDHVTNNSNNNSNSPLPNPGRPVILPSSFNGSPRNMAEAYQDTMAIVRKYGKPDLFVTFTCNTNWPEILSSLNPGQIPDDRPDLLSRVFHLYFEEFLRDLQQGQILGKIAALVYVIEFQKRGYPHAHLLIHLADEDKLNTPDDIDSLICAQLPDPAEQPELHALVTKFMMHGPCGALNKRCPCMKDDQCTKKFPKPFSDTTIIQRGYPKYQRIDNGRTVHVRGHDLTNRDVVAYNGLLLLKYKCHINVESCQSVKSVKYVYKYVFKGHDSASLQINIVEARDEIKIFVDGRYISPPEAAYRLFEFKLKGRSHSVEKLPVHLPNMQSVFFIPEEQDRALERAMNSTSKLEAYFKLNSSDPAARQFLYSDIPLHYGWQTKSVRAASRSHDDGDDDDDADVVDDAAVEDDDVDDDGDGDDSVGEDDGDDSVHGADSDDVDGVVDGGADSVLGAHSGDVDGVVDGGADSVLGADSDDVDDVDDVVVVRDLQVSLFDDQQGAGPSGWRAPPRAIVHSRDDDDLDDLDDDDVAERQSDPLRWWRDKPAQRAAVHDLSDFDVDSDDDAFLDVDDAFLAGDPAAADDDVDDEEPYDDGDDDDGDATNATRSSRVHWKKRQRLRKVVTRLTYVSPRDTERFSLRLLLLNVPGATSYPHLRTVDDIVCSTFREACLYMNLIDSDDSYFSTLREACTYQMPDRIRQLFSHILLYCDVSDPWSLWIEFRDPMMENFVRAGQVETVAEQNCLLEIQRHLDAGRKTLRHFDLPDVQLPLNPNPITFDIASSTAEADRLEPTLNPEQRGAADAILSAIVNHDPSHPNMFFIDGPGGSGKTYTYNYLVHKMRSLQRHVSCSALTGIASTLLIDGITTHSTFKVPVPCHENTSCALSPTDAYAIFLKNIDCFIIDEVSNMDIDVFNSIDRLLRDLTQNDVPFGGKVLVLSGDYRQTLPVVKRGTTAAIIEKCILRSPLWSDVRIFRFTANMRLNANQLIFQQFLLQIGEGRLPPRNVHPFEECIQLPSDIVLENKLIDFVFPFTPNTPLDSFNNHAILCPTNKLTSIVNQEVLDRVRGQPKTYYSADSIVFDPTTTIDEEEAYPVEFLNTVTATGLPPHKLTLKVGAPVMLLRNIDSKKGLSNGTRLQVKVMHRHYIDAEVLTGKNVGDRVYITAMPLQPSDTDLPFKFRRKQLPIRLAYAMTINKSQGQTFDRVGILLDRPCFAHGQLYVAMSRVKCKEGLKVQVVSGTNDQGKHQGNFYTKNIVYTNLLQRT